MGSDRHKEMPGVFSEHDVAKSGANRNFEDSSTVFDGGMTCIRCRECEAPEQVGLCAECALHTKIEVTTGFRRLSEYLTAWAAFDEWLRQGRA